jgi:hypothetical protein
MCPSLQAALGVIERSSSLDGDERMGVVDLGRRTLAAS